MIGFNHLGRHGRLGNQMFQYAALRGIAAHRGLDFAIPPSDFKDPWTDHQLFEAFKLTGLTNITEVPGPYVEEKHFKFDQELFDTVPDGHNIFGYFQTEKYFKHIEKEIREDFQFKNDIYEPCKEFIDQFENPIAIHIRRGDYLQNKENHPFCTKQYYFDALENFDPVRPILVFSDDVEWCKAGLDGLDRFHISEGGDNIADLCMMSLCNDFVIANSSFSWWGAWLSTNKKKRVYAPKRWFGTTGYTAKHDTCDLYCPGWKVI
jgi:hypothetical protein